MNVGSPQVAYLETIARSAEAEFVLRRLAGRPCYANVRLSLAPRERGAGNSFEASFESDRDVDRIIATVSEQVQRCLAAGAVLGFPVVDTRVKLVDFEYDEGEWSAEAFAQAARRALKDAAERAGIVILEPIMAIELEVREEHADEVVGLIRRRRGVAQGARSHGGRKRIVAEMPLADRFGWHSSLQAIVAERPIEVVRFSHYAELPRPTGSAPDDPSPAAERRA